MEIRKVSQIPYEAGWEKAKNVQDYHQGNGCLLWRIKDTFLSLHNFIYDHPTVLMKHDEQKGNVENGENKEKFFWA